MKQGQKKKNPESLKHKYFSPINAKHSTWFADVNNCPKLLRLKSLPMVGQMIVFFCVTASCGHQICTVVYIEMNQLVFMASKQFSNHVPLTN